MKIEKLKKLGDINEKISLYVGDLNFVVKIKNDKDRVIDTYYFPDLKMCLEDLANSFILENISHLEELKKLDEKLDKFFKEIRSFLVKLEKEKEIKKDG